MTDTACFDEDDVFKWKQSSGDWNELYDQGYVPGMMLLDHVSSMVSELGDEDETVILSGVTAARFRDPVMVDEEVTFELSNREDGQNYTTIDFEARVEERESLVAHGALSLVID